MITVTVLIAGLAALVPGPAGELTVLMPGVSGELQGFPYFVPEHSPYLGFDEDSLSSPVRCRDIPAARTKDGFCWVPLSDLRAELRNEGPKGLSLPRGFFVDLAVMAPSHKEVEPTCIDPSNSDYPCPILGARLDISYERAVECDVNGVDYWPFGFHSFYYRLDTSPLESRPLAAGLLVGLRMTKSDEGTLGFRLQPLRDGARQIEFSLKSQPAPMIIVTNTPREASAGHGGPFGDTHSMALFDLSEQAGSMSAALPPILTGTPTLLGGERNSCPEIFTDGCDDFLYVTAPNGYTAKFPMYNDRHRNPFFNTCLSGPPLCPKLILEQ